MPFTQGLAAQASIVGQTANCRFEASTGWGTTPSTLTLVAPKDAFGATQGQVTDLTITCEGVTLIWRDVLIVTINESTPQDEYLIQLTLLDRRWRWKNSPIDGDYNAPNPDGTLKREKKPRELASLLFQAMGETGFDVSNLPDDARPRAAWRAAEAASELEQLCSSLGCAVTFNGPQDRASIVKIGEGAATYSGPHESRADGQTLPIIPDRVRVKCGTVLFQTLLYAAEAVGIDTDGKIKPIDQLSYKPTATLPKPGGGNFTGWDTLSDPIDFDDIEATYIRDGTTMYARDLAKQSVFRWYRFTGQVAIVGGPTGGPPSGTGWAPLTLRNTAFAPSSLDDIGPFLDTRLERDPATGNRLPIFIAGTFADERENGQNTVDRAAWRKLDFRINNETKCVEFSEPVYRYARSTEGGSGTQDQPPYKPAEIVVCLGYSCSKNGVPIRYEKFITADPDRQYGAGDRVEHHDEIVREVIEYRPDVNFGGSTVDNLAKVEREADHYLNAIANEYRAPADSAQITLPLIHNEFETDGKLREIGWSGGSDAPARTRLAYNAALEPYTPDFRDTPEARAKREAEAANRARAALLDARLRPPDPLGL